MQLDYSLFEAVRALIPLGVTLFLVLAVLVLAHYFLNRRYGGALNFRFRFQLFMLVLSFLGFLAVLLALPLSEGMKGQLLALIGILLSGVLALSATTFVGNIMAGLMLRAVRNFRPGDFIRVGDYFGRVSELELFHVELQTESRDLATLPNLYLATNPVKVIRSSGTLVTAEISLGYDVPNGKVSSLLRLAAGEAGLEEPFVHIVELGNFAVSYRVAGLLTEVKNLLTTRSRLKQMILDTLHSNGIEIVSPSFMNQRLLSPDRQVVPVETLERPETDATATIEAVAFDKAEEAESLEKLRDRHRELEESLRDLKERQGETEDKEQKAALKRQSETIRAQLERLAQYVSKREQAIEE
jgi:small-conductance mechanosensitive channel